ncbi:MAG: polyhydroxyalkanoate synthesis repressor PhaR [Pseudomonadota bacterium]
MASERLIKKYANRRLYDTEASKHVTLDGIRELITAGHDVRILDDTSGDDITRAVLLQVITEQEQGGRPVLDADLLMRIIRLYGNPAQDLMSEYLVKSFDAFMVQQSRLQEQMRAAMAATPFADLTDMMASNMKAWQAMQERMMGPKSMGPNSMGKKSTSKKSTSKKNPPEDVD